MDEIPAKTIVTRTKSSAWFGCNYNMNIYRGCSHGCIYCDSRSSCYGDADFARVKPKQDALRIIRDDLRRKVRRGVVATGSMSDPYNPLEADLQLTRNALELLNAYSFGAAIATKSALVTRDIDILRDIASHSPVLVKITITTPDDRLASVIEPDAPSPRERFAAMEQLARAGVFCGVLLMPVLPFITDKEESILHLLQAAADSGARFVYPGMGVTLRDVQRDYFYARLDRSFPGVRGKYERAFGQQYECASPKARGLYATLTAECRRLGLLFDMRDIISGYKSGYGPSQLAFTEF